MTNLSVPARIRRKLETRLACINGTGKYRSVAGLTIKERAPVSSDFELESVNEIAYLFRVDEDRSPIIQGTEYIDITIVWAAVLVKKVNDGCESFVEYLIADFERAMEVKKDLLLFDTDEQKNLLKQPLYMANASVQLPNDAMGWEAVAFTVETTFPHRYGDPEYVE